MNASLLPRALVLAALAGTLHAGDIHVQPGQSIQRAIDAALDGDRVVLAPGRYAEAIDFRGKAITVLAPGGPESTVIDATRTGAPVVAFHSGEGPRSRLIGLTLRGGTVTNPGIAGAGISAWTARATASPTIEDCIVRDNRTNGANGGGVAGEPSLLRCSIFDNEAVAGDGGGLWGAPRMRLCVVASNTATDGAGGGLAVRGTARVHDTHFLENTSVSTGRGGGIHVGSADSLGISGCLLLGNGADAGLRAPSYGGALAVETGGTASVDRCTILGNRAQDSAGGGSVGGVAGPASIRSSILRRNALAQVAGARVGYSDVQGGARGTGNFDANPLFVAPSERDFHLLRPSPCIDAGDPATTDPDGSRADVGAFPFQDLYTRANATRRRFEHPGWPELSKLLGGRQDLRLVTSPRVAGRPYRILGSFSGTRPGFLLGGKRIPLNPDRYTRHTYLNPNGPVLFGGFGLLDRRGIADAHVRIPPMRRLTTSMDGHHAGLVYDGLRQSAVLYVSRPEALGVR